MNTSYSESNMVNIKVTCKICGEVHIIKVYPEDIERYKNGALIQDAFSYIDSAERELLISGFCSKCWDRMMSEE